MNRFPLAFCLLMTPLLNLGLLQAQPQIGPVSPINKKGLIRTFTFTFSHSSGAAAISWAEVDIGPNLQTGSSCFFIIQPSYNALTLMNDNAVWNAGLTAGSNSTTSNSQCSIAGTGLTITPSGNTLTVAVPITFFAPYGPNATIWAIAQDIYGQYSGNTTWTTLGSWTIGNPLHTVQVSPSSGSSPGGQIQTFTFTGSDDNGSAEIGAVYGLVGPALSTTNSCMFQFRPSPAQLWLLDNNGNWLAPITAGSGQVQNSQCTIYGQGLSVRPSGVANGLDFIVPVALTGYSGAVNIWMANYDNFGGYAGWNQVGTWSVGSSAGFTLSPTSVEINLSSMPIDHYFDLNQAPYAINGCPTNITVRDCIRFYLFDPTKPTSWPRQGVTGVRFFFGMFGGASSTPFNPDGTVRQQWADNLGFFFYDLRSNGIQRVTPTPVFDTWSGPDSLRQQRTVQTCTDPDGGGGQPKTLNFYPWLPYALDPSDSNFPENGCSGNNNYYNAAQTPNDFFWGGRGWSQFFGLMDAVLGKAAQSNITVDSLDYYQESNMSFTVEARMIYDNARNVDVLQQLRDLMSAHGFDPGRVSPSANSPPSPTPANFDCGSFYGDSAMLLTLSELSAAIAGPYGFIGSTPFNAVGPLACFSSSDTSNMRSLPVYHSQPTFLDIHSQKNYPDARDTTAWATNFYSDIWSYMQNRGRTADRVVFGETNPVDNYCSEWTPEQAAAMLTGYKSSSLFANASANVVMRPWHRTEVGVSCTPSPNQINPPYNPRNP